MNAIETRNIRKLYKDFPALDGLTFTVRAGELYGLLGPNGAGKTTLIRILVGLIRATSGDATVLELSPRDPKLWTMLGYMPQDLALYLDLTVQENMELFGRLYGLPENELKTRIDELLQFVDLARWKRTLIANLSGGMKHRTSLAVALLPKPRLLVLDEPTVGVDPELRAAFWKRFDDMRRDGTTILMTTHYMDEAVRCDRVGLMRHGKLIAEGTPDELRRETNTATMEETFLWLAGRNKTEGAT
ncbi:MAG: ABC transporter ATP-binding protein [Candidatus Kerfeldbacteria bacterium]